MENNNEFKLPEDDMAFRKIYRELLENKLITTVFRPGARRCATFRGYCIGDVVNARIIDELGLDRVRVAPEFLPDPVKQVKIEAIDVFKLGELEAIDFSGSSPDVYDKQSLIYHLGVIYNLDPASLTDEAEVTRTSFIYL